ncbi:hypothetical protein [Taylorella equigenitalis]|uniref:hypothetical protein n=1 Tax=Taylorella equigenitalis TaxID=29575 RepID=UPI00237E0F77|nr:hypothetical protein [Taylorella equigenitalis]WDU52209.1 hypothetical protein KNO32_01815 [Taylorella equigenitalis]
MEVLKIYLTDEERKALVNDTAEIIAQEESYKAYDAGDIETAWKWFARAELSNGGLKIIKKLCGEEFMIKHGFPLSLPE